jgi:group I intron endonuclease
VEEHLVIFLYICNMTGIYKITSPTNRVYIGSSNDIANRWCKYKRLKCRSQTKLFNSFLRYGVEKHVFEIIEECSISDLLQKELKYGLQFKVLNKGLNCRLPKAGEAYSYMSEKTKNKISKANKNKGRGVKKPHYESKLKSLSIEEVVAIKKLLIQNTLTQKEIGKRFSVDRKIISNICMGKTYYSIGENINLSLRKKQYIKLGKDDYINIKKLYKEGTTVTELSKLYNVDYSHIYRIINNKDYIK